MRGKATSNVRGSSGACWSQIIAMHVIWASIGVYSPFYSLQDTVKKLGHEGLDIDWEGCEWEMCRDWMSGEVPLLHQILAEVCGMLKDKAFCFYNGSEGRCTFTFTRSLIFSGT